MEAAPSLEFALQREVASILDYVPCAWYGCQDERHYTRGPGAGYCHEHGLVRIRQNQERGVQTKRERSQRSHVTEAAKKVVAASRELDASHDAVRKAEERKQVAANEWRAAMRELIAAGQAAIRG